MSGHRRSIRLNGFDYSNSGYYFVTVCVHDKLKLFWENNIDNKRADTSVRPYIKSNEIGKLIDFWFDQIPNHFKNVLLDEFIIMPDHVHFILVINNYLGRISNQSDQIVGVDRCVDPINENKKTLGNVIQWFKTMTTNEYIKNVKTNNWPRFDKRLWQRNYFERIIRNEKEYLRIKEYIKNNPKYIGGLVDVRQQIGI